MDLPRDVSNHSYRTSFSLFTTWGVGLFLMAVRFDSGAAIWFDVFSQERIGGWKNMGRRVELSDEARRGAN